MHQATSQVTDFHRKMNQHVGDVKRPDVSVDRSLRVTLIEEEVEELKLALRGFDKFGERLTPEQQVVAVADALGDISYVTVGAAVTWGIPLGVVFDEVHRSNMTKKAENRRADGKVLKDADYEAPDVARAIKNASEVRRCFVRPGEIRYRCGSIMYMGEHAPVRLPQPSESQLERQAQNLTHGNRHMAHPEVVEVQTSETPEARVSIARHSDGTFTVLDSVNK